MHKPLKNDFNFIFVGGVPRSGTTLVQNILDSHSDIYGGAEFDRIPNIIDLYLKFKKSIQNKRIEIYLNEEELKDAFKIFINNLFKPILEKKTTSFISEKTPWNILVFPELLEIYPNAKFIHIIRDPRAVVNSSFRVHQESKKKGITSPDFTKNVYIACKYIIRSYEISKELKRSFPNNFIEIKFENLIEQPKKFITEICDFIGVSFEDAMLSPGENLHDGENTMSENELWYTKGSFKRNFDNQSINKWKTELSKGKQYVIGKILEKDKSIINEAYLKEKIEINIFYQIYLNLIIKLNLRLLSNYKVNYRVLDKSVFTHYPFIHYVLNFFYRKK